MSYLRHKWLNFETGTFCLRCLSQRQKKAGRFARQGVQWQYKPFLLDTFSDKIPECTDFKLSNNKWIIFEPSKEIEITEQMELFCADGSLRHKYDFDLGYTGAILLYRHL